MDNFLGEIRLFPYGFAPKNWEPCRGQLIQINDNTALYSLLGPRYGGDGRTTFALPNLMGAEPLPNMQYCIALVGSYPQRS